MKILLLTILVTLCLSQQIGHQKTELHQEIDWLKCDSSGSCNQQQGKVVLDSNWRWTHKLGDYQPNCYDGNSWDANLCSDPQTCAQKCAIDGVDHNDAFNTYHVDVQGDQLELGFVTKGQYSKNVGSRTYLLKDDNSYEMFNLLNNEFTFDVDVSQLPCGLNGALYFVEMPEDGGKQGHPGNKGGAAYGEGYCDAQCPHDIKWINGEANLLGWNPSPSDPNSGVGKYGICCNEMDIWEANSQSSQLTAHSCSVGGYYRCDGEECGDGADGRYKGVCDKDGCDFNPFRMGSKDFFGEGSQFTVDTSKKMTVVTQFLTDNQENDGTLKEIKRFYVQNGKVIGQPNANIGGVSYNSIQDETCSQQKTFFKERDYFQEKGGLKNMGESMSRGMVLVMSIWDDHAAQMLWLDSDYPVDQQGQEGNSRGPCSTDSGKPEDVEKNSPNSKVQFSNIKFGPINSTFPAQQLQDNVIEQELEIILREVFE